MSSSRTQIINQGGLRPDNRLPTELRSLSITFPPLPTSSSLITPDGSATVSYGLTTVTASVFGPRELPGAGGGGGGGGKGREGCELIVEVGMGGWVGGRVRGRGDKKLQDLYTQIHQTFLPILPLPSLPSRSQLLITLSILSTDGPSLPTCITATSLALLTSSIPLLSTPPTSLSIGLWLDTPLLDLTGVEESEVPHLTLAVTNAGEGEEAGVVLASMDSRIHVDRFRKMIELGVRACGVIEEEVRRVVRGRVGGLVERGNLGGVGGGGGDVEMS